MLFKFLYAYQNIHNHNINRLSALLVFCAGNQQLPVDSPHRGLVMWGFGVFYVISLNELFNKQFSCWWSDIPWWLCDIIVMHFYFDCNPMHPSYKCNLKKKLNKPFFLFKFSFVIIVITKNVFAYFKTMLFW